MSLPFLESIGQAQEQPPVYTVFVRQGNGVTQGDSNGESDRFWPYNPGPIDAQTLASQTDRVLSILAPWADKMIAIKGLNYGFPSNGCAHSTGGNQCLTAARHNESADNASRAMGESVDNYIARHFHNNGGEPLTLYTGPRNGYIEEVLSYRGPEQLRAAEDDPWIAYQRMLGVGNGELDELVFERRQSVNDLVLDRINALMSSSKLSLSDRQRLELHFDSIREFENLNCKLHEEEEQRMALQSGQGILDDYRIDFAKMHMDLIALAFHCDFARAATLQIGDGNDGTEYTINGERLPSFHWISHRIQSDGAEGDILAGAEDKHHAIDRLMANTFAHLLGRLEEYDLLDQTIATLCSDLGSGVSHSFQNVPFVLFGSANGFLKTGQFIDLGGQTHNKLFNTIISATGIRNQQGLFVTDFGDPELDSGIITELIA